MENTKYNVLFAGKSQEYSVGEHVVLDVTEYVAMMGVHNILYVKDEDVQLTRNFQQLPFTLEFDMPAHDVAICKHSERAGTLPIYNNPTSGMGMGMFMGENIKQQQSYVRPEGAWKCECCGEDRNVGNFCTNCGAPRTSE